MAQYLVKRALSFIPTVLGVVFLIFILTRLAPGGPVLALLGPMATEEQIARTEHMLGLDRPLYVQFFSYVWDLVNGDLGNSIRTNRPVLQTLLQRIGISIQLVLASMLVSIVLAFPIGIISGIKTRSLFDKVTMMTVVFGVSVPNFWLALMLVLIFGVTIPIFPLFGVPLITKDFFGGLRATVLPAIALGVYFTAMLARSIRGSMIEVLSEGHIRMAKGLGLPNGKVYLKYALKMVMIPTITLLGLQVRYSFGALAVIESVFAVPGIGRLMVEAILTRDYPLIQGTLLLLALIFVAVNLLVDVAYGYLDPRIKW